jgi:hypothetical protein
MTADFRQLIARGNRAVSRIRAADRAMWPCHQDDFCRAEMDRDQGASSARARPVSMTRDEALRSAIEECAGAQRSPAPHVIGINVAMLKGRGPCGPDYNIGCPEQATQMEGS